MNSLKLSKLSAAMLMAFACGAAFADGGDDSDGFHGYFRDGIGASSTHGPQSCFGLGGNTMKYRLGNECDSYAEFGYTKELINADGVSYVGTFWVNSWAPNSSFSGSGSQLQIAKAYVEAKGLDFMSGGTVWIGKRYYVRPDIHMLDLQYINLNGTGAGLDKMNVGPGKLSYAVFKDNDDTIINQSTGAVTDTDASIRQNLVYQGLPVNQNGTLDFVGTLISAQGQDRHNGWQLSVFHRQDKVFGGGNTFGIQYGVGPGTGIGVGNDRMGSSGSTTLGSDVTRLRVFNDIWVQPTENFGMEMVALVQRDKSDAGGTSTWTSVGARPEYALTKNFKLQLEVGTDQVTSGTGGPTQRLTKVTFAPTISAGKGFWSRPELRAFVTYGKWNNAATAAVNASNNSGPVYNNGTSGTSIGFQVEAWW
jgi:maltoporin